MKFVFRGVFANTPEEWSFSLKFSRDNTAGVDATVGEIADEEVTNTITGLINTGHFPSTVHHTEWRAYAIGPDGKMEGNPLIAVHPTPIQGAAAATPKYPTDSAVCITSEAANRGPARFGRFYLPCVAHALGTDFRLAQADAASLLVVVTDFCKNLSDTIDLEATASAEMLNISSVGATGARQTVRNLRLGRVLDRIERRRRSMDEAYEETGVIDW
jgi:hypothetical protein